MWWYCGYDAHPGVNAAEMSERFLRQHDAGSNHPERIRGWFMFASGTAGFVMVEAETPKDLSKMLAPYAHLVHWTVESAAEILYPMFLEETRQRHVTKFVDASHVHA